PRLSRTTSTLSIHSVPGPHKVQSSLGRTGLSLDEANRAVLMPGGQVQHTTPGDVVLLKGETWPGNDGSGAVHRSPPIEEQGARRLLLKFDTSSE
ncbi:MAG: DUF1826 domain-containing protein, partial [Myxococcota bacterium]